MHGLVQGTCPVSLSSLSCICSTESVGIGSRPGRHWRVADPKGCCLDFIVSVNSCLLGLVPSFLGEVMMSLSEASLGWGRTCTSFAHPDLIQPPSCKEMKTGTGDFPEAFEQEGEVESGPPSLAQDFWDTCWVAVPGLPPVTLPCPLDLSTSERTTMPWL